MEKKETQLVRTCPMCGERALSGSQEPILVEFREDSYSVDGFTYEVCSACGETLHPAGQIDEIHGRAVATARRERGLLTPEEIRQLRVDLRLTQVELESILGVGAKSVTRWEKGTVFQSAVADNFMRSIWQHPEILGAMPQRRPATACKDERLALDLARTAGR